MFTLQPNWTRSIFVPLSPTTSLESTLPAGLAAFLLATGKAGRVSSGFPILLEAADNTLPCHADIAILLDAGF